MTFMYIQKSFASTELFLIQALEVSVIRLGRRTGSRSCTITDSGIMQEQCELKLVELMALSPRPTL